VAHVQAIAARAEDASTASSFQQLLAEEWQSELRASPQTATTVGDYRYNDRWDDPSVAHWQARRAELVRFQQRFAAITGSDFSEADQISLQVMRRQIHEEIEAIDLKGYEMPLDQINGAHLGFVELVALAPFETEKQYQDYISRLHALPAAVDAYIEVLKQGVRDGLMPPKYLLEKVAIQCAAIAKSTAVASAFAEPVRHFPESVPLPSRVRLSAAILSAIEQHVKPAYTHLADFVARDYAPHGRTEFGVWALPDGAARYRFAVASQTTTAMDPEAIHQLGLVEVSRIETDMTALVRGMGYSDLPSARAGLRADPSTHPRSRAEILDLYRSYLSGMNAKLPELFGILPKTSVEVRPVEAFREKDAPGASYLQGTPNGSRPGAVYVNTREFAQQSILPIEATAYHEGVPGHHLQISIAQALPDLPAFRQQAGFTAYVEGWALYSEHLGKELGFYRDPRSEYGRLSNELLRADRLVLDTGVHFKRWSREQMVEYFRQHSSQDEPSIEAEVDRYIADPGQALAYKIGELKIRELRDYAKTTLGARFDIRRFHDELLSSGALPLDVLDSRVRAWVRRQA
jgi:uncharacterized protein (DUF885 family)